jgi:hypothetical protein
MIAVGLAASVANWMARPPARAATA